MLGAFPGAARPPAIIMQFSRLVCRRLCQAVLAFAVLAAACGQKGPLRLPPEAGLGAELGAGPGAGPGAGGDAAARMHARMHAQAPRERTWRHFDG
ncbi:MAG: lipoprotein [Gammaproteobacteria bacterium]|nr:lipoprotein [Gammaproteobacteria bacterium]